MSVSKPTEQGQIVGQPHLDRAGPAETDLCLILPGQHVGSPERIRVSFKVTQQLVMGTDLLAWGGRGRQGGSGCFVPLLCEEEMRSFIRGL